MHPVTFRNPFERTSQPPRIVAVIPSRLQSSRLPGKPLADIGGRPMIEHVYRRTASARLVEAVVVATADARIAAAVEAFGGVVRMTRASHRTGTDRLAEVAADLDAEIVVNVQGDEPLVEPATVDAVVEPLLADVSLEMSTACTPLAGEADFTNPHVVKVVIDRQGNALYFSRAPIPYAPAAQDPERRAAKPFKHLGIYGYRRAFLMRFAALSPTPLEISESLEQLRALEHGIRIHTAVTPFDSIGVDTPEDLERVRQRLLAVRT